MVEARGRVGGGIHPLHRRAIAVCGEQHLPYRRQVGGEFHIVRHARRAGPGNRAGAVGQGRDLDAGQRNVNVEKVGINDTWIEQREGVERR